MELLLDTRDHFKLFCRVQVQALKKFEEGFPTQKKKKRKHADSNVEKKQTKSMWHDTHHTGIWFWFSIFNSGIRILH